MSEPSLYCPTVSSDRQPRVRGRQGLASSPARFINRELSWLENGASGRSGEPQSSVRSGSIPVDFARTRCIRMVRVDGLKGQRDDRHDARGCPGSSCAMRCQVQPACTAEQEIENAAPRGRKGSAYRYGKRWARRTALAGDLLPRSILRLLTASCNTRPSVSFIPTSASRGPAAVDRAGSARQAIIRVTTAGTINPAAARRGRPTALRNWKT